MRRLFAWDGEKLAGFFEERPDGSVAFFYDSSYTDRLSLSLPTAGEGRRTEIDTARNYLDGFLPESTGGRLHMQRAIGAQGTDAFSLLSRVDSVGGLVFTPEPEPKPSAEVVPLTAEDYASEVARIRACAEAWWDPIGRSRFSLPGTQSKFTYAVYRNKKFWPSVSMPSSVIVKPEVGINEGAATVERATMALAGLSKLNVPHTRIVRIGSMSVYETERFDRLQDERGVTHRLKTEDLTQALGMPADQKYDVTIQQVIGRLRDAGVSDMVAYEWLRQVAFNSMVENTDAHAKNYSLFTGRTATLCPLYDAICMEHWSSYRNQTLAIPINDVFDPWEVTLADWAAQASACGLDPDRVVCDVLDMRNSIREALKNARLLCELADLDPSEANKTVDELRTALSKCTRDLETTTPHGSKSQPHGPA